MSVFTIMVSTVYHALIYVLFPQIYYFTYDNLKFFASVLCYLLLSFMSPCLFLCFFFLLYFIEFPIMLCDYFAFFIQFFKLNSDSSHFLFLCFLTISFLSSYSSNYTLTLLVETISWVRFKKNWNPNTVFICYDHCLVFLPYSFIVESYIHRFSNLKATVPHWNKPILNLTLIHVFKYLEGFG